MKAVVVTNTNEYGIEDVELESPKANEIKVRLEAAGLCHSDLSLINGTVQGPLPLVLGHEGAGIVTEGGRIPAGLASVIMSCSPRNPYAANATTACAQIS